MTVSDPPSMSQVLAKPVILGYMWLVENGLEIDWCMGDIHMTRCPATCNLRPRWIVSNLTCQKITQLKVQKDTEELSLIFEYTLKRFCKCSQRPPKLNHHQALHA